MIDIETDIYNLVCDAIEAAFGEGKVEVSGVYSKDPAHFPFVSIEETDNASDNNTRTTSCNENFANLIYDVNVYSNRVNVKKRECKQIMAVVDEVLMRIGFSRMSRAENSNLLDSTVYRMTARYRCSVDRDHRIFNRR